MFAFKKEIQVDGTKYTVTKRKMNPLEILQLAYPEAKDFTERSLNVKRPDGERYKLDEFRFLTLKRRNLIGLRRFEGRLSRGK